MSHVSRLTSHVSRPMSLTQLFVMTCLIQQLWRGVLVEYTTKIRIRDRGPSESSIIHPHSASRIRIRTTPQHPTTSTSEPTTHYPTTHYPPHYSLALSPSLLPGALTHHIPIHFTRTCHETQCPRPQPVESATSTSPFDRCSCRCCCCCCCCYH